ncbi:hypothetical protein BH11PSE8_BH11PSE8_13780 [soil metagenome]
MHIHSPTFASADMTTMPMHCRSEGFAEDLCQGRLVWRDGPAPLSFDEAHEARMSCHVGPRFFGAALLVALAACVAPEAAHPLLVPGDASPSATFVAMPPPQLPFDATVITGVETVGASASE